jgi:23S rRNA pseudouridine1911/1915/1917 synthase
MLSPEQILFEDNHLLVINKKPSQLVQGDKTGDASLKDDIAAFLKNKYQKPGDAFVGVIHRLDRPVSGIVVFAKTSKALARMNELFRSKEIQKTYWAVVKNKPPKTEDKLIHYLIKDEKNNKSKIVNPSHKNALKAELDYKLIASSENYHLLEIILHTGRHHQIRVQLSQMNCPIKGDIKYGFPRTNKDASIHLHSRNIKFIHPVKDIPVEFTADPPQDPVWDAVKKNSL